jgi:hypothetical protein
MKDTLLPSDIDYTIWSNHKRSDADSRLFSAKLLEAYDFKAQLFFPTPKRSLPTDMVVEWVAVNPTFSRVSSDTSPYIYIPPAQAKKNAHSAGKYFYFWNSIPSTYEALSFKSSQKRNLGQHIKRCING